MIPVYQPLHTGRLILTPRDVTAQVDCERLAARLGSIGLIGSPLSERSNAFETGERFLDLVAFTGCAVQLDTRASAASDQFTHVSLHGPHPEPRLLYGRNSRPPRCPECAKGLKTWRNQVAQAQPGKAPRLCCEHCQTVAPAWQWSWGQHAGVGRSFVHIEEVFPGEASPLSTLLEALGQLGVGEWRYFYVQD